MNDPLEIPEHIRKAAATVEIFFKVNGINEWALMGIQSRRSELECEACMTELAELKTANNTLHNLMVSGERRGAEKAEQELAALKFKSIAPIAGALDDTSKVLLTKEEWEETQRDKVRLDWMEKERPNVMCLCVFKEAETGNETTLIQEPDEEPIGYVWEIDHVKEIQKPTLRQAIDAARADTKGTSA